MIAVYKELAMPTGPQDNPPIGSLTSMLQTKIWLVSRALILDSAVVPNHCVRNHKTVVPGTKYAYGLGTESDNGPRSHSLPQPPPLLCEQGGIQRVQGGPWGRTPPSDPRSRRGAQGALLPPPPLRGCYLRLVPKRAVGHQATPRALPQAEGVGRDPGPRTLGSGKAAEPVRGRAALASASTERRGGVGPALLAVAFARQPRRPLRCLATPGAGPGRDVTEPPPPRPHTRLQPPVDSGLPRSGGAGLRETRLLRGLLVAERPSGLRMGLGPSDTWGWGCVAIYNELL